jgi:hypothetical protein
MISFDDYGGSAGGSDVDLTPIYASLGAIKSNTHMIWDFVSTISNTTVSYSTPYLETYRSENDKYMYNITGLLPTLFANDSQIINGIVNGQNINVGHGNYNYGLSIDYIGELLNCTFSNDTLSLVGNDFRTLSFNDIIYLELKCKSLEIPIFSNITNATILANKISGDYSKNFLNNEKMYLSGFGDFNFNGFSVGTVLNIDDYGTFMVNSVYKILSMNLNNISDVLANELCTIPIINVVAKNFNENTLSFCQNAHLSVFSSMTSNSLSDIKSLIVDGNDILTNTFKVMTKAEFDVLTMKNCSFSLINNLIGKGLNCSSNTFSNVSFYSMAFNSFSSNAISALDFYIDGNLISANTIQGILANTGTAFLKGQLYKNQINSLKNVQIMGDNWSLSITNASFVNISGQCSELSIAGSVSGTSTTRANVDINGYGIKLSFNHINNFNFNGPFINFGTISNIAQGNINAGRNYIKVSLNGGGIINVNAETFTSNTLKTISQLNVSAILADSNTFESLTNCYITMSSLGSGFFHDIRSVKIDGQLLKTAHFANVATVDLWGVDDIVSIDLNYMPYTSGYITELRLKNITTYFTNNNGGIADADCSILNVANLPKQFWNGNQYVIPESYRINTPSSRIKCNGVWISDLVR